MIAAAAPPAESSADIDAPWTDCVFVHNLTCDSRDQRRLASVALLVSLIEPVPALLHIRRVRLPWISNKAGMFFGRLIHASAGSEVLGRLLTAVQHDDERNRLARAVAARHIEFVGSAPGLVAERSVQKPRAIRQSKTRLDRRQLILSARWQLKTAVADPVQKAAQLLWYR